MSNSEESMRKKMIAMAVAIFILLGTVGYLIFDKTNKQQIIEIQNTELNDAKSLQEDLQTQYEEIMTALDEQKGENEELNALVDSQKEQLEGKRKEISRMIRKGNATKDDLENARVEIGNLKVSLGQYLSQIDALNEQNQILTKEKVALVEEKKVLQTNIQSERVNNENLTAEKAVLVSKKEELEVKNENLNKKVNYASVIRVTEVSGIGMKVRNNGKMVKKTYAKNVELVQVCFKTTANDIAPMGSEDFLVRIINPIGETMVEEGLGSGVFVDSKTKDQIRFTQKTGLEYERTEENSCISWSPNAPFSEGVYEIEVYNKGYLAGTGSFMLK